MYRAFMFSCPTILVTTPDACKRVLMDDDSFADGWPKATVALIGSKAFFALPREEHRRLRKLTAAPINGSDALSTYLGFIDRTVAEALRRWSEAGEIEFLTELRRVTFKIIVQIFLTEADYTTMRALETSYTDLNNGIRAMAINLPGFTFHKAFKVANARSWKQHRSTLTRRANRSTPNISGSQEASICAAGCPEQEEGGGDEGTPQIEHGHDGSPDRGRGRAWEEAGRRGDH